METKKRLELEVDLSMWCLPLAVKFEEDVLCIGFLCFQIFIST